MTDPTLSPLPPLSQEPTNPYVAPMLSELAVAQQQGPGSAQNPYVGSMLSELDTAAKERDQRFAASYRAAMRTDPAMFAEAKAIAKQMGEDVSPDAVLGNLKVAREVVKARAVRYEDLRQRSPILAEQLSKTDFVRIARDDLDNLETTESTFGWLKRNVQAGQAANMRGYIGTRKALGIATPQEEEALIALEQLQREANMDPGVSGNVAQTLGQMADTVPTAAAIGAAAATPMLALGPAAPVSASTTFTVASGAALFTQSAMIEGGNAYLDMIDNGYDHQTAASVALGVGLVNGSLELVGTKAVAKPFQAVFAREAVSALSKAMTRETAARAFGTFVRDYAKSLGAEVFTETAQEAVNIAAEDFARRISRPDKPEQTPGQVMDRLGEIFTKTAMSMGVLSVPGPALKYAADAIRAGQATQQARAFDEMAKLAGESQARKLDGESYGSTVKAMAEANGAPLIYVDAKALGDVLRQQDKAAVEAGNGRTKSAASQLDEKLPGLSEQIAEAERDGGDVVIRTDDWASKLAGTELDAILRPHMRFDPEGVSLAQAEEYRKSLADMQAGMQGEKGVGTEAERAFAESAAKVEAGYLEQIEATKTVDAKTARAQSRLLGAFVETQSQRLGITPEEFAKKYPLSIGVGVLTPDAQTALRQEGDKEPRAAYNPKDWTLMLFGGLKADPTSFMHESGHFFMHAMEEMAASNEVTRTEWAKALEAMGTTQEKWAAADQAQRRKISETFAYSFEDYLAQGEAPSAELRSLFSQFRVWMLRVYGTVRDALNVLFRKESGGADLPALSSELRGVFDRMLASQQAIDLAQAERGMASLFLDEKARKAAGITEEQWADMQDGDRMAREEAVAKLTAMSLRGLEYFENSRNKALRELGSQARKKRQEFRAEAEKEVAARPVYRAIRLLRDGVYVAQDGSTETVPDGERVRLDAKAVRRILGVEEQAPKFQTLVARIVEMGGINPKGYPGEKSADYRRLMPGLFSKKGMNWEELAQALEADGFGPERPGRRDADSVQSADYSWLYEAVDDAAGGLNTYRREDAAKMQAEGPQSDELTQAREEARKAYRRLVAIRVVQAEGGVSPDVVGEMFDMSGEAMVREMASARSLADEIKAVVDDRMDREVGLTDPKRLRAALAEALHGRAQAKMIATELRHLLKTTQSTASMIAAAKEAARRKLLTMEVGRISPRQFVQAEARAAKQAREALASGDVQEAIEAQRRYLLQHELTRQALDIEKEVDKFVEAVDDRYFADDEKVIKGRNLDIVQAARSILGEHGLASGRRYEKALAYLTVLKEQNPELHAELEGLVAAATIDAKDYRSTTLEQWRVMVNAVESLWDRAKRAQEIEVNGQRISKEIAVQELVAAAQKRYGEAKPPSPTTDAARKAAKWSTGAAMLKRVEHFTEWLDGGTEGPWTRYVFRPMRKRFDAYMASREKRIKALRDIIKGLDLPAEKIAAPELGTVEFKNTAELLGAMLHMGNASNLQKLLGGYGWGARLADGSVDTSGWWRFMAREMGPNGRIKKEHVDALQAMWDLMEDLKGEAQQVNRALYGTYFEEIEAQSFATPWGRYKGGYAPAKPDPTLNPDLGVREGLEAIQDAERNFRESMPSAGRGFAKTRNQSTRPLLLDVRLVGGHVDEVLRFVHLQPSLRDVASLLRNRELAGYLNSVDKTAIQDVLVPWLERTAANRTTKRGAWSGTDTLLNWLKTTSGLAAMFGSITNSLQQVTGLSNAAVYVPWRHLRAAMWDGWTNSTAERVASLSTFMDSRLNSQVGQLQDDIDLALQPSRWAQVRDWTNRNGYFLQRMVQNRVDPIVWMAAFNHSLEQSGANETDAAAVAKAVDHADSVVRKSQGSQSAIDVAKYEVGTPLVRVLTQFSGYFNTVLNQIASRQGVGAKTVAAAHALILPTIVAGAIAASLNGREDIEDKDGDGYTDEYLAWFFGQQARAGASLVPVLGPNAMRFLGSTGVIPGVENPGNRIAQAPAFSMLESVLRTAAALPKLASGDATPRQVREFWRALTLSGVPVAPIGTVLTIGADERR